MKTIVIYFQKLSFHHLYIQFNVVLLVDDFFPNSLTIMAAFHHCLENCDTEFFTVENLDYFIGSVPSNGIPYLV